MGGGSERLAALAALTEAVSDNIMGRWIFLFGLGFADSVKFELRNYWTSPSSPLLESVLNTSSDSDIIRFLTV